MTVGTTATVALLRDGIELVVGSVGDSRAMLCRKGEVYPLTSDHTPERKDEKQRYRRYLGALWSSDHGIHWHAKWSVCVCVSSVPLFK